MGAHSRNKAEFGDFQTPNHLCRRVCDLLLRINITPHSIVEPTCGTGGFLRVSVQAFPNCESVIGFEVNSDYAKEAKRIKRTSVECANFFSQDWPTIFHSLVEPILVIGNPPWITNAAMRTLGGTNLPIKSNIHSLSGLDALTGKSNFDISESMLLHLLECLSGHSATLAMLCKTSVARKVLQHAWNRNFQIKQSSTYAIDSREYFGVAVDACLLVCLLKPGTHSVECDVYENLETCTAQSTFALHNGRLIADAPKARLYTHLYGRSPFKWRSGIKHDCSRVMELRLRGHGIYENGLGDRVQLEPTYIFPMLKSSEVAKDRNPSRYMLVPQRTVGEDTLKIQKTAPLTWAYLNDHGSALDGRLSTIYRNQPRFSVFGVGDYSFAPWKVAISGFYKQLHFRVISSIQGKPVVFDDTCYFLYCYSESDAQSLINMLRSHLATGFFHSHIFWDAKRPITAEILGNLNLDVLSKQLGIPLPKHSDTDSLTQSPLQNQN